MPAYSNPKFLLSFNLVMVYITNSINPDQIAQRSGLILGIILFDFTERKIAATGLLVGSGSKAYFDLRHLQFIC